MPMGHLVEPQKNSNTNFENYRGRLGLVNVAGVEFQKINPNDSARDKTAYVSVIFN